MLNTLVFWPFVKFGNEDSRWQFVTTDKNHGSADENGYKYAAEVRGHFFWTYYVKNIMCFKHLYIYIKKEALLYGRS